LAEPSQSNFNEAFTASTLNYFSNKLWSELDIDMENNIARTNRLSLPKFDSAKNPAIHCTKDQVRADMQAQI
jgi:hypothetical protein